MKYMTLSADYMEYSLRGAEGGAVDRTLLPPDVQSELELWNDEYQSIISLSVEERASQDALARIRQLDSRGVSLAASIANSISGAAKVTYYSEGLMRRITE